jgi:hypothetical protein
VASDFYIRVAHVQILLGFCSGSHDRFPMCAVEDKVLCGGTRLVPAPCRIGAISMSLTSKGLTCRQESACVGKQTREGKLKDQEFILHTSKYFNQSHLFTLQPAKSTACHLLAGRLPELIGVLKSAARTIPAVWLHKAVQMPAALIACQWSRSTE